MNRKGRKMTTKERFSGLLGFVLVSAILVVGAEGMSRPPVRARIDVNVPVVVSEPPEVVIMPDTGIYYVPSSGVDIFFYNNYWWSRRGDGWYRTRQYNGSWGFVQRSYVPAPLFRVPRNYRVVYRNERHINYRQWRQHPGNTTNIQRNTINVRKDITNVERNTINVQRNAKVQRSSKVQRSAKIQRNVKSGGK